MSETITTKLLREGRINNDFDHTLALVRIEQLMDKGDEIKDYEEFELDRLVDIVVEFEERTYGDFLSENERNNHE